jgi:hypothetical protein
MKIIEVKTKHVTTSPYAGLCEIEPEFSPYFSTKITTDSGVFWGRGETPEESSREAAEAIISSAVQTAKSAISKYNAEQGVYFIDL